MLLAWPIQGRLRHRHALIRLVLLPAVHVEDVCVRTSVAKKQFSCHLRVRNSTNQERKVSLAAPSSWNQRDWRDPAIPPVEITVPAKSTAKATLGPVAWDLGPESYWWPNIPFRENYTAQLHFLNVRISEHGRTWEVRPQRFGFVEHAEGPFYYTVNGVRVTGFSDATAEGQVSCYDSYSSPAWRRQPCPGPGGRVVARHADWNQHESPALFTADGIHDESGGRSRLHAGA